jgi:ABC-type lipoprotein release transport system permease subunit
VIHKNLTRNPKRVSRVSIIIALSMGFGIFMTTMIGTTINGMELEARAIIGADLLVETTGEYISFENELEGIQGVDEVIPVCSASGPFLGGDDYNLNSISLFNATEYMQHIEVPEHYFVEGSFRTALNELSLGDSIIIGDSLAQTHSLKVGSLVRIDEITVDNFGPQYITLTNNTFRVAAVVRAMPGLEIIEFGRHYWGTGIYMDFSALESPLSNTVEGWHFLVDVEKGVDSTTVENAINRNFTNRIKEVKNLKTTISDINNDVSSNSILFIMLVNIGFMTIIITVGLGLILFISINERKNELATIMARGAERKQISVLILGEALSITLLGTVVGLCTGLFTAYTFNKMITTNSLFGIGSDMMSGRPLFIPWYGALVILLALAALILTSLLAAFRANRIKLNQALRLRGG